MAEACGGGPGDGAERWFLDACVLYPQLMRGVLLSAARAGLFRPFWSMRVLEEWRIAAARSGGMAAEAAVRAAAGEMAAAFPGAAVTPDAALEAALHLPDPADAHVAAGAAAAGALVVTLNIRDFPVRRLAAHGIAAEHADSALWRLHGTAPAALDAAVADAVGALEPGRARVDGVRGALKRAGLPRLAKALAARP
ncbi:MAG: PIN domain-containing protein [Pseudomonadota bacterium]